MVDFLPFYKRDSFCDFLFGYSAHKSPSEKGPASKGKHPR